MKRPAGKSLPAFLLTNVPQIVTITEKEGLYGETIFE